MKNFRFSAAVLAMITLIACSVTGSASNEKFLETLHGLNFNKGLLEISVTSNGCTKPRDFTVHMNLANGIQTLSISRLNPDVCRQLPHQKAVKLKWPAALDSGAPIQIANPFREARIIKRQ